MTEPALVLKRRLQDVGLSGPAINAAWPRWWSEAAEASSSARAELRFSLARKLGLDPSSLLDESAEPRFVCSERRCLAFWFPHHLRRKVRYCQTPQPCGKQS